MSALIEILVLIVLLVVIVLVISAPLRAARQRGGPAGSQGGVQSASDGAPSAFPSSVEHDDLEAAREAKYREIRDTELDFRTGKLSQEDYAATDAQLRAEALEILDKLEGESAEDAQSGAAIRPRDA
jgi:hypothetical protein